jgi:hypothetical protein
VTFQAGASVMQNGLRAPAGFFRELNGSLDRP